MSFLDKILRRGSRNEGPEDKVIDLSDRSQYPGNVLADLNHSFGLGDDSTNFLEFLHEQWTRPSFHWGWDDITHEEAVESNFLFRAYSAMNIQYKVRRDALIAAEGCRFVWKDKDSEPVPGLLTGDQLCELVRHCLETHLQRAKDINASEEREERRRHLNPTFEDLMADREKEDDKADYMHRNMGCGMVLFKNRSYGNKQIYIVDTAKKKVYPISTPDGRLVGFSHDDIDWDNVNQLEHNVNARRLVANYADLGFSDYQDGIARVDWMLYPNGRYFADGDGFGREDNEAVIISAYINTECRVVGKFKIL